MKKFKINIQAFANANTNTTGSDGMSVEIKTFYDTELLSNAKEQLIFNQFGKKQGLPGGKGKSVEWRKVNSFAPAITPLTEGVTPDGSTMTFSNITATVSQHGDYITVSDVLDLTAIDDVVLTATEEMGAAGGQTKEVLTRDVVSAGTNVIYAPTWSGTTPTEVTARESLNASAVLTPDLINKAATKLKKNKTPKIDGKYVAIVHPSCTYDLRSSEEWIDVHKYAATTEIFNGEIGELHGVRFVESNNAKIFAPLYKATVKTAISSSTTSVVVKEALPSATFTTPVKVWLNGTANTVTAITYNAGGSTLTIGTAVSSLAADKSVVFEGAGSDGSAVYATLVFGKDAYGIVDPEGAGMEVIVKPLGAGDDPLNQRSTIGYKFSTASSILYPERIVRIESGSSYSASDVAN